jgi:hypothetical protein
MRRSALLATMCLVLPAAAFAGFRASSFKKETKLGANYWNAASALDGRLDTAWMVDPESENIGEWIEVDLPKSQVDKIAAVVGWAKDEGSFKDHPRLKTVKVQVFGLPDAEDKLVHEQTIHFEDKLGWQTIDIPDTAVGGELHGGKVRLTVVDVYAGEDFPNLAVSEVLVHLKDQDVPGGAVKLKTPPTAVAPGRTAEALVDGDPKTYWAGVVGGDHSFEVRAEGFGASFVGILPGPAGTPRPKTVEITANDIPTRVTLTDKSETQWFPIPAVVGYTGSAWGPIRIQVIDTYGGKDPAIAEVKIRYTNFESL